MWIARDVDKTLVLYGHMPERNNEAGIFVSNEIDEGLFGANGNGVVLPKEFYPEVTWENSPAELVTKI